jgi:hypothetical protein
VNATLQLLSPTVHRSAVARTLSITFPLGAADLVLSSRCAPATTTFSVEIQWQSRVLEQAEQFKDDHDNDNYSDYVKDVSVHGGD